MGTQAFIGANSVHCGRCRVRLGNHARKRLLRGDEMRFNHGYCLDGVCNAVVEYPARVECKRCSAEVHIVTSP
jgi:hypothetical protein